MAIGLIPPVLQALEDRTVTTSEIGWLIQESIVVIVTTAVMATLLKTMEGITK